jgi:hypothetical protein
MAATLAAGVLVCGMTAAQASAETVQNRTVTIAILPPLTTVDDLARIDGMAVGLMSTGIGNVPPEQTYLDISQGNRVDESLYDGDLPPLPPFDNWVPGWQRIVARANSAPADIYPGLLAGMAGSRRLADPSLRGAALIVANRPGFVKRRASGFCAPPCRVLKVMPMTAGAVDALAGHLSRSDLLVALAAPTGAERLAPIGIAGQGLQGELTSDSTRTPGYVLSTNLLATVVQALGGDADQSPFEITKEPIRGEGTVDAAALTDLAERMAAIPDRREPILVLCILAWLLVAFSASRIAQGLRRSALAWLALCFAYMPLVLLAGAWIEPGAVAEGVLVGVGAAVLAAFTVRFAPGWHGLAIACAITVVAYAIDVIAGSGLTRLSLLGPNPIYGARFYGIGNELEALFAVMVPVGVGAGLSAWHRSEKPLNERKAALAFLAIGFVGAFVFGAGRFGADVGAAIVLPIGAAVAAASLITGSVGINGRFTTTNRHGLVLAAVIAAPIAALALLVFIDLVSGANAHLTRSVLDAGGTSNLADVAQRRLELSAHDFAQAAGSPLFWVVVVGVGLAISRWRRIDAWLRPAPMARAGLFGACAATVAGVLVNDSGATFLVLGSLALGAFLAYAWAQAGKIADSPRNPGRAAG